jgi:hypothetical protein
VLSLTLLGGFAGEGIDKGELECEEAVKHLIDCCPDDSAIRQVSCYVSRYCGSTTPELPGPQARCLRDSSCDDLYASGACSAPKTTGCVP